MKTFVFSVTAAAVVALAPAVASTAPAAHDGMAKQPMTRAAVVEKVQQHFAKLDSDRDGFVTKAEADAAREQIKERVVERIEERREGMFDRMDANKDGTISRQEFDAGHKAVAMQMKHHSPMAGKMMHHGAMAGHLLEMADADKDGRVSLQEATAAAVAHFDKADANRDGTLTPEEMRSAHAAMRAKSSR